MMGNGMQPSLLEGFFNTLPLNVKERHKYIAKQTNKGLTTARSLIQTCHGTTSNNFRCSHFALTKSMILTNSQLGYLHFEG
jgi:hypothetical protein